MKFYDRVDELAVLETMQTQSEQAGRMTVITGRRRVGKTMLALEFAAKRRHLYLFVSKKSEGLLCEEFAEEIRARLNIPLFGEIRHFRDLFALLIEAARTEPLTVVLDEFQEFYAINPAVYSELQRLWDLNRAACKLHVIFIGSVQSLMRRIFEEAHEPLFGRADRIMLLQPFPVATVWNILQDHGVTDVSELFFIWALTGGLPKYLDALASAGALTKVKALELFLSPHSPFLNEGKNLLVEEFGREYGTYFSILELIASGKTSRPEIDSTLGIHSGAYLARLEQEYAVIAAIRPLGATPGSRVIKYVISDNFLSFWFRFVFRNRSAVETGNFVYLREVVERDWSTWSGRLLERYFQNLVASTGQYNRIGNWWEKGNKNEIDLVAVNDLKKIILAAEIKLNPGRASMAELNRRVERLKDAFPGYAVTCRILGVENAHDFL
ncbi:MAG: hypothetical protein A2076_14275 [Geobacteraceae bacterium GWC2_53_11]|nr:MAG: hypothetical protein A2076_14275 [Geobacteraceae bacterium GWC2_53_11]